MSQAQVDPGCPLLFFLDSECTILKADLVRELRAHISKASDIFRLLRIGIAIEETSELLAVAVQIKHNLHPLAAVEISYVLLDTGDLGKDTSAISRIPFPIKVAPREIGSVVTHHNAIRIDHWNDFDNEVSPEKASLFGSRKKVVG